jgi:hypothetical protein
VDKAGDKTDGREWEGGIEWESGRVKEGKRGWEVGETMGGGQVSGYGVEGLGRKSLHPVSIFMIAVPSRQGEEEEEREIGEGGCERTRRGRDLFCTGFSQITTSN